MGHSVHSLYALASIAACCLAADVGAEPDVRRHNAAEATAHSAGRVSMRAPRLTKSATRRVNPAAPTRLPVPRPKAAPLWFDTETYCLAKAAETPTGLVDEQVHLRCLELEEAGEAALTVLWPGLPTPAKEACIDAGARQGQGSYARLARCAAQSAEAIAAASFRSSSD